MSKFQENLKKYREMLGISAKDFAAQIGIKYSTFSNYENQGREPKYDTLCIIAAALHVSIDDLLGYTPDRLAYWVSYFQKIGLPIQYREDRQEIILYRPNPQYVNEPPRPLELHCDKSIFLERMEEADKLANEKFDMIKKDSIKSSFIGLVATEFLNHPEFDSIPQGVVLAELQIALGQITVSKFKPSRPQATTKEGIKKAPRHEPQGESNC